MLTTKRTFPNSSSWLNMLYCTIFLCSFSSVAQNSTMKYSAIILLPTPSVRTPSKQNQGIVNHNIKNHGSSDVKSISSISEAATPMQGFLSLYGRLSSASIVSRTPKQKLNSFVYITSYPSFSITPTITHNCEFSQSSQVLQNLTATENNRSKNNGSDILFKIHSIKNKNSSNSKSLNMTITKISSCVNDECRSYVTRWVDFYLNVGGWIMLAVVLIGVTSLIITHILGRRSVNSNEISRLRGRDVHGPRYRAHWI
ncbi:uncharacterized protein LOC116299959 [Actinia tenebrosa]|uniref:Uncharacterized protein LOC116299959 n=1 Tax=Actinia tenebrosa TaxID=6105 RepID=A0A6P8IDS5_ACTTE|nr:uncharacterized protein LOC116299959 [Actinia tenebrosa]